MLNSEITDLLNKEGCNIVGFADVSSLSKESRQNFVHGIVIGLSLSKEAMMKNKDGDPSRYYDEYLVINERLPELARMVEGFLIGRGYKALAKLPTSIVQDDDRRTVLPHKTVATLSGIGWIGKCSLLVTKVVGSALQMIVVLTDAPLECGTPTTKSQCSPDCTVCRDVCPGKAINGRISWEAGMDRTRFFNADDCYSAARARARAKLDVDATFCGLCISNCPFTKKGLEYR
jgi:epoxyqueuosine reductase QueG